MRRLPLELSIVPTPFQHLCYAERLFQHHALPETVRRLLYDARGPYLLGSTAGDVQVITAAPRVTTHFYRLADIGSRSAVASLLAAHPDLASPALLRPDHAAFITGYLVHLVWDEVWAREIYIPLYHDGAQWRKRRERVLHHNALRVLLDREAYTALQGRDAVLASIRVVTPDRWLPFAPDCALVAWREWLVAQLVDSSKIETATVFAQRMHMPLDRVEKLVAQMHAGSYTQVPDWKGAIKRYESRALAESVETVLRYWGIGDRLQPIGEVQPAAVEV